MPVVDLHFLHIIVVATCKLVEGFNEYSFPVNSSFVFQTFKIWVMVLVPDVIDFEVTLIGL